MNLEWIQPDWPAPACVRAISTTRLGGVSTAPYDSLNLGTHVGDDPQAVAANRQRLRMQAGLPAEPLWLTQVHGVDVIEMPDQQPETPPVADAAVAREAGRICVIMTADCLPVLFTTRQGDCVAAAHAGWRGLAAGVLPATLKTMGAPPDQILAWLGPAIGPQAFEVGDEVRAAFLAEDAAMAGCFAQRGERWLADLYGLARWQLARLGLEEVYGGGDCTYSQPQRFFSYRRDGHCGRMASLIWLQA